MLLLCKLAIRARPDASFEGSNLKTEIEALATARHVHETALPRLNDRNNCRTIQDRIEYYSLRICQGFTVSCMSQTLMMASIQLGWDSQRKSLLSICREGALDCLQAFVDMTSFSIVPLRTWMFIFSALSSALVLAVVAEDSEKAKLKSLQRRLLDLLSERDSESDVPQRPGWFARYPKALQLLNQVSGAEKRPETNGRESSAAGDPDSLPETLARDLLDPATMWNSMFSAAASGTAYPAQPMVLGA
jgi:hypothetical protein